MTNAALLEQAGIDLRRKTSGSLKTTCPNCSDGRKNKKDPCLSVEIDEGVYNCHNCGFSGRVFERKVKEYVKPPARLEKLGAKALDFFENKRKISNDTLLKLKVTESVEFIPQLNRKETAICFNYYRDGQLVNIKFRGPEKSFFMAKDAELVFYNLDAIKGEQEIVIVEGEIDCMSFVEANVYNVVSVPNGASKGNQKLEYLDNCWEYFQNANKVIIATDDDDPGKSLREELARRIGKEKCLIVDFPEGCKDANEVLMKFGKDAVRDLVKNATPWPLEGIVPMDDVFPTIQDWFINGYPSGTAAGIKGLDKLLRFEVGQVTTITGIPSHGKDEFFNGVLAGLVKNHHWHIGVCGFEESVPETVTKLAEKITGKSFAHRKDPGNRMSQEQFEFAIGMIDEYFHFFNTDDIENGIDGLLDIAKVLILRFGTRAFMFNPWNWFDHNRPAGMSETDYVSKVYSKIILFARKYAVHIFIIAHTTKMMKDPKTDEYYTPTLYNISGSAHFYNKTHNGVCVYRSQKTNEVTIYVQKVKQSWLGERGWASYTYDTNTRQYTYIADSVVSSNSYEPVQASNWKRLEPEQSSMFRQLPPEPDEENAFL